MNSNVVVNNCDIGLKNFQNICNDAVSNHALNFFFFLKKTNAIVADCGINFNKFSMPQQLAATLLCMQS